MVAHSLQKLIRACDRARDSRRLQRPPTSRTKYSCNRFLAPDGQRTRITVDGGSRPAWSPDGSKPFFFDRHGRLSSVAVDWTRSGLKVSEPRVLLPAKYFIDVGPAPGRPYDVAADGRFIMIKDHETTVEQRHRSTLVVVQKWIEELKRLAPRN
jgi:hypothetical protein